MTIQQFSFLFSQGRS